uniref:TRUD domain-containing protein n=1 Tax=Bionectria ochroleuca TaxID=29856 RepID=A0A8H7NAW2_BIOOC
MGDRASASRMRALGITQSTTPLASAWTGDLRVRFTDFQVNEISEDGSVVHLSKIGLGEETSSNQTAANPPAKEEVKEEAKAQEEKPAQDSEKPKAEAVPEVSAEDVAILASLAGEQFAKDVVEMFQNANDEAFQKKTATAEPTDDRSKRGQIHQEHPQEGAKRRARGGRNNNASNGPREEKPSGDYLHFTLYKENRDTLDAVNQISRMLRVKPQAIGYAGTKDRRASTAQRCSVRHMRQRALAGINGKLRGVETGDYEYKQRPIHLGELRGNEFAITIKNCTMADEALGTPIAQRLENMRGNIEPAMDHLIKHGWINYFGHQRFGTHEIGTHEIGKLILGEKYQEAVDSLLSYDPEIADKAEKGELPEEASKRDEYLRHQACMLFRTGKDYDRAEKIIPRRFGAETSVLRHLNRSGIQSRKDLVGALIHITRGLRTMYLHAYQSHVWNHVASRRWELYGEKAVKGDLVIVEAEQKPLISGQDDDGDDIVNVVDDEDGDNTRARALTEEEAASGRYTIRDIVLPSPGYEVIYPDNEIGAFYAEFMGKEENGKLDPHQMRRMRREWSLPGRYRKLMNGFLAQPSFEVKAYADDMEQMNPTDLDLLRSKKAPNENGKRHRDDQDDGPASKKQKDDSEDGAEAGADKDIIMEDTNEEKPTVQEQVQDKIAVVVKFQLGSSAYATVTLRELMGDPPEETN